MQLRCHTLGRSEADVVTRMWRLLAPSGMQLDLLFKHLALKMFAPLQMHPATMVDGSVDAA